jgi:hypothetical protein
MNGLRELGQGFVEHAGERGTRMDEGQDNEFCCSSLSR